MLVSMEVYDKRDSKAKEEETWARKCVSLSFWLFLIMFTYEHVVGDRLHHRFQLTSSTDQLRATAPLAWLLIGLSCYAHIEPPACTHSSSPAISSYPSHRRAALAQTIDWNQRALMPANQAAAAASVGTALEGMGIRVHAEWLEACLAQLPPPPPGPPEQREQWVLAQVHARASCPSSSCPQTHLTTLARSPSIPQVYDRFLHSDLNASGRGGAFPPGLGGMREHTIQGTHVLQVRTGRRASKRSGTTLGGITRTDHRTLSYPTLHDKPQVDALKNISQPAETRSKPAAPGPGRCLLLALTDGSQRAVGMEYGPIPDLRVDTAQGLKVR